MPEMSRLSAHFFELVFDRARTVTATADPMPPAGTHRRQQQSVCEHSAQVWSAGHTHNVTCSYFGALAIRICCTNEMLYGTSFRAEVCLWKFLFGGCVLRCAVLR